LKTAFALVPDLMLRSRVAAMAAAADLSVRFFGEPDELSDAMLVAAAPDLLILDLSDRQGWGMRLLERMQTTGPPPTLGFYAHVEDEIRRRALALGVTRVVPRSLLIRKFADLVRETIEG
jgi:DNA-binding NarL/FixJ family response regulator